MVSRRQCGFFFGSLLQIEILGNGCGRENAQQDEDDDNFNEGKPVFKTLIFAHCLRSMPTVGLDLYWQESVAAR